MFKMIIKYILKYLYKWKLIIDFFYKQNYNQN